MMHLPQWNMLYSRDYYMYYTYILCGYICLPILYWVDIASMTYTYMYIVYHVYIYIHIIYIYTYIHTLHYIALHCITLHYIHTYTYIYIYIVSWVQHHYCILFISIPSPNWDSQLAKKKNILGGVVQPPTRWTWGTEPSKNGGFTGNMCVINAALKKNTWGTGSCLRFKMRRSTCNNGDHGDKNTTFNLDSLVVCMILARLSLGWPVILVRGFITPG